VLILNYDVASCKLLRATGNGGNIQLTEDDIKRLELIVQPKGVETE